MTRKGPVRFGGRKRRVLTEARPFRPNAEMGAAYLCGVCGIANATLANSAAYLQSWMQVLRHDATLLVHAAAQAQKAADYIQNLQPESGA